MRRRLFNVMTFIIPVLVIAAVVHDFGRAVQQQQQEIH